MRSRTLLLVAALTFLLASTAVCGSDSEEEFVKKYFGKIEKKHAQKLGWLSGYFSLNRINRDNDYNKFASFETTNFTDATLSWLGEAKIFGLDMGLVFHRRFAWNISLEYWLKIGQSLEGTYFYVPTGTYVENPTSEVTVYGASTGLQYYFWNPPSAKGEFDKLALRGGANVGFYKAKWEVWDEYQNLNLSTNSPDVSTASFEDQAVSFSALIGVDYPTGIFDFVLGVDFSYQYLNFDNVAWYNEDDEEIIATYTGTSDGRVNLGLSGFRGKIEIKHFVSW
ncbi:MAG: hypothetical protein JSV52_05130 [Candidatus Zixiibacteriota bacterium]|nr:MAG: hypothetical protein JSV52_05130 [candidate division Zixibacteria bacterium]